MSDHLAIPFPFVVEHSRGGVRLIREFLDLQMPHRKGSRRGLERPQSTPVNDG